MRAEVYFVSADFDNSRCPRCAAMVRPGSQWCTLCYADLRPAPVPVVEPAAEQAAQPEHSAPADSAFALQSQVNAQSQAFDPRTAPLALLDRDLDGPDARAQVGQTADARAAGKHAAPAAQPDLGSPGWPCATCGATVPFDESSCPSCGAGFLENVDADTSLHRFGLHTGQVSKQTKALIMIGGSLGLLVLLLGIMYVIGTLL
ncbi:MAG: hypothetical protein ACRDV3_14530 [Acidothermaceae bacterium]